MKLNKQKNMSAVIPLCNFLPVFPLVDKFNTNWYSCLKVPMSYDPIKSGECECQHKGNKENEGEQRNKETRVCQGCHSKKRERMTSFEI